MNLSEIEIPVPRRRAFGTIKSKKIQSMMYFKNKYQMIKATDDEIREFFATTIFEGVFSHEIRSSFTDKLRDTLILSKSMESLLM